MAKCFVGFCPNRGRAQGIYYFKLSENRYNSWLEALGLDPEEQIYSYANRICSAHFNKDDISISPKGKPVLRPGAFPTINLGPNVEQRKLILSQRRALKESMEVKQEVVEEDSTVQIKNEHVSIAAQKVEIDRGFENILDNSHEGSGKVSLEQNTDIDETDEPDIIDIFKIKNEVLGNEDLAENNISVLPSDGIIQNRYEEATEQLYQQFGETRQKSYLTGHLLQQSVKEESVIKSKVGDLFQCNYCDYQCPRKANLKRHSRRHKKPGELDWFRCGFCDYRYLEKGNLNRHLIRHKNPGELYLFQCKHCDYRTHQKVNMTYHLLKHEKPGELDWFQCGNCDYRTLRKGHFRTHLLRHKNPDELDWFHCYHCDYRSIRKRRLKAHMLKHKNPEVLK